MKTLVEESKVVQSKPKKKKIKKRHVSGSKKFLNEEEYGDEDEDEKN